MPPSPLNWRRRFSVEGAKMPPEISLKEHLNEIVDAKLSRIEQMLSDRDKALLAALATIEQRINETSRSVRADIDRLHNKIETHETDVDRRLMEIEKPKYGIWIAGSALIFSIVSGLGGTLWFLAINPYQQNLTRIETQVEAILQGKNPPPPAVHLK
jgi:hypothetical protein